MTRCKNNDRIGLPLYHPEAPADWWVLRCDTNGCGTVTEPYRGRGMVPLAKCVAAGWFLAKTWGDKCPPCVTAAGGLERISTEPWRSSPLTHVEAIADTGAGFTKKRTRVEDGVSGRSVPGWEVRCLWCDYVTAARLQADAIENYRRHERAAFAADEFNLDHPVGTLVRYWTGGRHGDGVIARTRTSARLLNPTQPVVWVEGYGACISLTHVEPVRQEVPCDA